MIKKKKKSQAIKTLTLEDGLFTIYKQGIDPLFQELHHFETNFKETYGFYHANSYIRAYDTIFTMCIQREPHNYSHELYEEHKRALDKYFQNTLAQNLRQAKTNGNVIQFLQIWSRTWKQGVCATNGMHRMFMYLDRFYVTETEGARTTTANGYISFYCNVFQKYANDIKYNVLRLMHMQRKKALLLNECNDEVIDNAMNSALQVFVKMDQSLRAEKVRLKDLNSNDLHIVPMAVVLNGYIREMESHVLLPLELVEVIKHVFGDLTSFDLLQQCIMADITLETVHFYQIYAPQWLSKQGATRYFTKCDEAILYEERQLLKWCDSQHRNDLIIQIFSVMFGQEMKKEIDNLLVFQRHNAVTDIAELFRTCLKLQHHLVKDELLSRIIKISMQVFHVDIKAMMDEYLSATQSQTTMKRGLLRDYLLDIFPATHTRSMVSFVNAVHYFERAAFGRFIPFQKEKMRGFYIQSKVLDLIYSLQCLNFLERNINNTK